MMFNTKVWYIVYSHIKNKRNDLLDMKLKTHHKTLLLLQSYLDNKCKFVHPFMALCRQWALVYQYLH